MTSSDLPVIAQNAFGEVIYRGPLSASFDDLLPKARALVTGTQDASTLHLQRKLGLGWLRACKLIEQLQAEGLVSEPDACGHREVLAAVAHLDEPAGEEVERRIFADAEQLLAAASDAAAFTSGMLSSANALENDAQVRELLNPGVEALLYALSQIAEPFPADAGAIAALTVLAEDLAVRRSAERASDATLTARGQA